MNRPGKRACGDSMSELRPRATRLSAATAEAICEGATVLRRGGLVVFPTETVYGLGADALNEAALRELFLAKGRPADHPVIVHVAAVDHLDPLIAEAPPTARKLAAAFWPGPMTLVFRRSALVSDLVTGGLGTVGLRVPSHPVAQSLLQQFGGPIAAPSANPFGRVSATRAEHVLEDLNGRVDLVLDGGPCPVGLESTIIDVTGDPPAVLRPGAITAEQIAAVLQSNLPAPPKIVPRVSGSLPSHYAPRARVEIVPAAELAERAGRLANSGQKVAVLSRQPMPGNILGLLWLEIPSDDTEYARGLYVLLRKADELDCDVILTTLPEDSGLGRAIADRLRRAAGPR
jgi:L-threonylcarbamoyladenylate synthase